MPKTLKFKPFEFLDEKIGGWYSDGRKMRKTSGLALRLNCRHKCQVVEPTTVCYFQICTRCFRTLFV